MQAGRQQGPVWNANPMYTDVSTDLEASAALDERTPSNRPSRHPRGDQTPSPSGAGRNAVFQGESDSLRFETVNEPLDDTPSPERLSEQNSGLQTPLWHPASQGVVPSL